MTTPHFIWKHLHQDMVYWGNPQDDGEGGFTFDAPVELTGRCEFMQEIVITDDGEEKVSQAFAYLTQDVDEGGYVYLGTLEDSSLSSDPLPSNTEDSMRIIMSRPIPMLDDPRKFLYRAYLNRL